MSAQIQRIDVMVRRKTGCDKVEPVRMCCATVDAKLVDFGKNASKIARPTGAAACAPLPPCSTIKPIAIVGAIAGAKPTNNAWFLKRGSTCPLALRGALALICWAVPVLPAIKNGAPIPTARAVPVGPCKTAIIASRTAAKLAGFTIKLASGRCVCAAIFRLDKVEQRLRILRRHADAAVRGAIEAGFLYYLSISFSSEIVNHQSKFVLVFFNYQYFLNIQKYDMIRV